MAHKGGGTLNRNPFQDLVFERRVDARNILFQLPGQMDLAEACQIDVEKLRHLAPTEHQKS